MDYYFSDNRKLQREQNCSVLDILKLILLLDWDSNKFSTKNKYFSSSLSNYTKFQSHKNLQFSLKKRNIAWKKDVSEKKSRENGFHWNKWRQACICLGFTTHLSGWVKLKPRQLPSPKMPAQHLAFRAAAWRPELDECICGCGSFACKCDA